MFKAIADSSPVAATESLKSIGRHNGISILPEAGMEGFLFKTDTEKTVARVTKVRESILEYANKLVKDTREGHEKHVIKKFEDARAAMVGKHCDKAILVDLKVVGHAVNVKDLLAGLSEELKFPKFCSDLFARDPITNSDDYHNFNDWANAFERSLKAFRWLHHDDGGFPYLEPAFKVSGGGMRALEDRTFKELGIDERFIANIMTKYQEHMAAFDKVLSLRSNLASYFDRVVKEANAPRNSKSGPYLSYGMHTTYNLYVDSVFNSFRWYSMLASHIASIAVKAYK